MESIIRELIQIESEADALVNEVIDEKNHLDQRIQEKKDSVREAVSKRIEAQIQLLAEAAHRETALKTEEISQNARLGFAALERDYQTNHMKWEAELVNQIIG
ncbi:MAG: hypothetical protein LBT44_06140 [Clostridiales bacterium]|nr:hypothetical protein [Clostridiales bacterium]